MSFQPVIPITGVAGWQFLQRTYSSQFGAFQKTPQLSRDSDYFAAKLPDVKTAADLVADRRLLSVALGAFGLDADIGNRFFIQKILEDGSVNRDALANRLSDTRYQEFSAAFGFGPQETTPVANAGFAASIIDRYERQQFEVAVGLQDDTMRIALFAERTLPNIAATAGSNDAKWFTIMGQPPLRALFEKAFRLPSSFGQIDIDQQLNVLKSRARSDLGSDDIRQFASQKSRSDLVSKYVARAQISDGIQTSSQSIALSLLQNSTRFQALT